MRIHFSPDRPKNRHFVSLAIERLGWAARGAARADLGFKWKDRTRFPTPWTLRLLARRTPVLNLDASDIGKRNVHRLYADSFGRALGLDPLTHQGPAVPG